METGGYKKMDMKVRTLFVILFASVCAGCFGMEDMPGASGPGLTLAMIIIVPILWAVPIALACAELGATLPVQGGYYMWVREALGPFWGYCAGFWRTWIWYLNEGILLVLGLDYMVGFFHMNRVTYLIVAAILMALIAWVNIIGLKAVSWMSVLFLIMIMVPFGLLVIIGAFQMEHNPITPFFNPHESVSSDIAYAIVLGVWMYGAFEGPASYAGEVSNFQKIFPKALALTVFLMTLTYFLPMLVGLAAVGEWESWSCSGAEGAIDIVQVCERVGGHALGLAMVVSAMFSNIIMCSDNMAATVRIPAIISEDGLAPKFFRHLHKKYKTPSYSIIFTCLLAYAVICYGKFDALIEFQTFVFFSTYIMLMIAVVVLRIKKPDLPRPYKAPLPTWGLICYAIPVIIICFYCIIFCSTAAKVGAIIFGFGAPVSYFIFKKIYGGIDGPNAVEHDFSNDSGEM